MQERDLPECGKIGPRGLPATVFGCLGRQYSRFPDWVEPGLSMAPHSKVKRILLVEDDVGAQLLYKNRLTDLGYQVVVSSSGAMGLMEARSLSFDLYLVDIELGTGIDG